MQVLWKQSLLPLLSPVCVDLSNSSQTYDCLFGRTCKKFHFFLLSYNFFLHYLSSPFSHTLSFFAFTQGKSYIKVVVKSLLLKICSPPTQQISFFHFQFFSSVLLEAICEISVFSNTTCLLSILTFTKVIYAHKLAFCSLSREIFREIFLSGEIFYIQDPLLAAHRCQSVTTIEGIAFLFLLFSLPATSML